MTAARRPLMFDVGGNAVDRDDTEVRVELACHGHSLLAWKCSVAGDLHAIIWLPSSLCCRLEQTTRFVRVRPGRSDAPVYVFAMPRFLAIRKGLTA